MKLFQSNFFEHVVRFWRPCRMRQRVADVLFGGLVFIERWPQRKHPIDIVTETLSEEKRDGKALSDGGLIP